MNTNLYCQQCQEIVNLSSTTSDTLIRKKQKKCQPKSGKDKPHEDMSRKKREPEKTAEVKRLEARIRELELQNLALNTLIDVAER
ncbi:MAG: hypothetical protein K6B12_03630, partial [Clostridiales bacterium]|nr:hypothetical protein [Clostridiales bacterium]